MTNLDFCFQFGAVRQFLFICILSTNIAITAAACSAISKSHGNNRLVNFFTIIK